MPREPVLETPAHLARILAELSAREPIFHRLELGTSREALEQMTEPDFWEVGASGRRYSREHVFEIVEERYRLDEPDPWQTSEFHCREVAPDNYLLTYALLQGERLTRRATLWRWREGAWRIVYHQGTVVEG